MIDAPGTYSLEPTSKAEKVAVNMLENGDLVINVVDATNLERNLYLTLAWNAWVGNYSDTSWI